MFYIYSNKYLYPPNAYGWEMAFLLLILVVDKIRLDLASRGNHLEQIKPLAYSGILSVPMVVGYVYFLELQVYV